MAEEKQSKKEPRVRREFIVSTRYTGDGHRSYPTFEAAVAFGKQQLSRNLNAGSRYVYEIAEVVAKVEPAYAPIEVKLVGDRVRAKGTAKVAEEVEEDGE